MWFNGAALNKMAIFSLPVFDLLENIDFLGDNHVNVSFMFILQWICFQHHFHLTAQNAYGPRQSLSMSAVRVC